MYGSGSERFGSLYFLQTGKTKIGFLGKFLEKIEDFRRLKMDARPILKIRENETLPDVRSSLQAEDRAIARPIFHRKCQINMGRPFT